MERTNTKQDILNAALKLFSTKGYEATSISQIAEAVGIRKASLYSHFSSKQDILDSLISEILEKYEKHSVFSQADWSDPSFTKDMHNMTQEGITQLVSDHIQYILHDPYISNGRRLLTIEQFQNPQMAEMQTRQGYSDILQYFTGLMEFLISKNMLADEDPEIMAAQLCLPISVWINLCDREPEREAEVMTLIRRHIQQFFRMYQAD